MAGSGWLGRRTQPRSRYGLLTPTWSPFGRSNWRAASFPDLPKAQTAAAATDRACIHDSSAPACAPMIGRPTWRERRSTRSVICSVPTGQSDATTLRLPPTLGAPDAGVDTAKRSNCRPSTTMWGTNRSLTGCVANGRQATAASMNRHMPTTALAKYRLSALDSQPTLWARSANPSPPSASPIQIALAAIATLPSPRKGCVTPDNGIRPRLPATLMSN
ncbi:hypothetical protein SAMN04489707_102514 [Paenacidovorax caeni]|uniref:Uncharacterized protein n=1 Tax=Paenacidovorax caeni TaxID=343013 RepID=A0A1I7JE22_9BURK|nr:hypothetical protein SAMN04489707_102514 [Paenacidovorax caeni]